MSDKPAMFSSGDRARLIPVVADTSKEVRAVSVLLAAMRLVPPFARCMMDTIGQRVGARAEIDCYTEVTFQNASASRKHRPDGYVKLQSSRGNVWQCLIEAKIGRAELDQEQVASYAEIARELGVDAIVTISNQFVAHPSHAPTPLPKVLARHVEVHHWSWMFIITQAMLLMNEHKFDNALQKYILAELVGYLRHDSVGTSQFDRMNREWKDVVLAVNARKTLSRNSAEVESTIAAWHQECRDLSLLMSRKIGRLVKLKLSRAHLDNPLQRLKDDCEQLAAQHQLRSILDIPDTASEIVVEADLMRRNVAVSMTLAAPKDKQRVSSRVNWLTRQLAKSDPREVFVEAKFQGRRAADLASLDQLRENPGYFDQGASGSLPTSFVVLMVRDLAGKFSGTKTFVEELEKLVLEFYENIGERLQNYVAKPPKIKREDAHRAEEEDVAADTALAAEIDRTAEETALEAIDEALRKPSVASDGVGAPADTSLASAEDLTWPN